MKTKSIFKRSILFPVFVGLSLVLGGFAQAAGPTATDSQVLSTIHEANLMEIQVGKLVASKTATKAVVKYAKMLEQEHTAADQKVMDLAKQRQIAIVEIREMREQTTRIVQKLTPLQGKDLDKEFLRSSVSAHEQVIQQLKTAQTELPAASAVKPLIEQLMPALEEHRDQAKQLLSE
jgi:putative membrane protein